MESLKLLLQTKKGDNSTTTTVVSDAVNWLRTQFQKAEVPFYYADGGTGHGIYGYFQIKSILKDTAITLHLKIAEIKGSPYVFAEIRMRGQGDRILFPFFGEIGSEDGKLTMLHYIADFVLSTTPDLAAL